MSADFMQILLSHPSPHFVLLFYFPSLNLHNTIFYSNGSSPQHKNKYPESDRKESSKSLDLIDIGYEGLSEKDTA